MLGLFLVALLATEPVVEVSADDTVIRSSCTIRIAPGAMIADAAGDGVVQIEGDGITVTFEPGSVLRGAVVGEAPGQTPWDALSGLGVRVRGRGVVLRGVAVEGFKVGVLAAGCDGLVIEGVEASDLYRQRLGSTPQAEDAADWLWPHRNDGAEWRTTYGGAVVVEDSLGVSVSGVRVRRGQNGIILSRVHGSRVFDNDCSFLSGWGLAMWRSTGNVVSRNAFDFCIRGHSEGFYNRGQDSAGILCFEQSWGNLFAENSMTHGGDGFFGFAGRESIGEAPPPPGFDYAADSGRNAFVGNDMSYAAAHGLELTFSDACVVRGNRFVGNALTAVWAGYSNGWRIEGNTFEDNGGTGGPGRGAVVMEHAGDTTVIANTFVNNCQAAEFWWDDDGALLALAGVRARYRDVRGNGFVSNRVRVDRWHPFQAAREGRMKVPVVHLRQTEAGRLGPFAYADNTVELLVPEAVEFEVPQGVPVSEERPAGGPLSLPAEALAVDGVTRPVGARPGLRGRHAIIMEEWGPWDHGSPMVRRFGPVGGGDRWQVFGVGEPRIEVTGPADAVVWRRDGFHEVDVRPRGPGFAAYTLAVHADGFTCSQAGTLLSTTWNVRAFSSPCDPREDLARWREAAGAAGVALFTVDGPLDLPLGGRGLRGVPGLNVERERLPGGSHYGLVAVATLPLEEGRWRVRVVSDDGVRVRAEPGGVLVENWTHHAPHTDEGLLELPDAAEVRFEVEYFQLDGHAVLKVEVEPAG